MDKTKLVGIIMGSDSDLPVMQEAAKIMEKFGVGYELTVVSAHRTPARAEEYAKGAAGKGLKVIIAGAGGAAHLAGVTAALTTLPVIGVPMRTEGLGGADSLYSTVQMPPGIPVATVGINAAQNAGLLAVEILAVGDPDLASKLQSYKKELAQKVNDKAAKLEELGYEKYIQAGK